MKWSKVSGGLWRETLNSGFLRRTRGILPLLSTAVNEMASSLNAHREAQKKAKDFLQDTITNISHQLKTPLAALFMYQDIIRQDPGEEETVKKFAAKSVKALERMQTLILNLLKMARLMRTW